MGTVRNKTKKAKGRGHDNACNFFMYLSNSDYRIEFVNQCLKERIGRDAIGEHCYSALYGFDSVCPWCSFEKVIAGTSVAKEICNPQDNRRYFISQTPFSGNETFSLSIFADITEQKSGTMLTDQ